MCIHWVRGRVGYSIDRSMVTQSQILCNTMLPVVCSPVVILVVACMALV